jgi:hypothetical protein
LTNLSSRAATPSTAGSAGWAFLFLLLGRGMLEKGTTNTAAERQPEQETPDPATRG